MSPGDLARFVDCSFERTTIEGWFCFAIEVVDCTFSGRLKKAFLNGTVRAQDRALVGRAENQFEGNDFSRASLIDVDFRTGIDLSKQRLPAGGDYVYLPDAVAAVARARLALNMWDDPALKSDARRFIKLLDEHVGAGQRQLLIRANDFPRDRRPAIRRLLEAAQGQ